MTAPACLAAPLITGFGFTTDIIISVNTPNFNLKTAAIAAGWNQISPLIARVIINAGISVYPLATGTGFPAGSALSVVNNGYISASISNGYGTTANAALTASVPISVTNNGTVRGSGGDGGGGYPYTGGYIGLSFAGAGAHGLSAALNHVFWDGGGGNTVTAGDGGTWGAAGTDGNASIPAGGQPNPVPGYPAGPCTSGNSNITWVVAGTRIGALV